MPSFARWIFASSLVDEFGVALPPVIQATYNTGTQQRLHGITLFANGHVLQLLEGDTQLLHSVLRNLHDQCKLIGLLPLLKEPISAPQVTHTCVGVSRFAQEIAHNLPSEIEVFDLTADEVSKRTPAGKARELLLGFM